LLLFFFALTLAAPLRAQNAAATTVPVAETTLTLAPSQSKVHYILDTTLHTVHGTFNLKSGTLHFDPQTGKASGEIVVLASSGDSGNGSRDARMHKEILETGKFSEAIFHPTQIEGTVNPSGSSDVKLRGILTLHGADHEVTAQVHTTLTPDHFTATARFDIPYVSWGIKDPSNFLLKAKPVVNIDLELSGQLAH
jgi:polyisoprenoid-binding protein YceI